MWYVNPTIKSDIGTTYSFRINSVIQSAEEEKENSKQKKLEAGDKISFLFFTSTINDSF